MTSIKARFVSAVMVLALLLLGLLATTKLQTAESRTQWAARRVYRTGGCSPLEAYWSIADGEVLMLCGMPHNADLYVGFEWYTNVSLTAQMVKSHKFTSGQIEYKGMMVGNRQFWGFYSPLGGPGYLNQKPRIRISVAIEPNLLP